MSASLADQLRDAYQALDGVQAKVAVEATSNNPSGGRDIPVVTDTSNLERAKEGEATFLVTDGVGNMYSFKERRKNKPPQTQFKKQDVLRVIMPDGTVEELVITPEQRDILFKESVKTKKFARMSSIAQMMLAFTGTCVLGFGMYKGVQAETSK